MTQNKIIWTKTEDGYEGYLGGLSADGDAVRNPDYLATRHKGRTYLFVAGSDEHVFAGTLARCQEEAEAHAAGGVEEVIAVVSNGEGPTPEQKAKRKWKAEAVEQPAAEVIAPADPFVDPFGSPDQGAIEATQVARTNEFLSWPMQGVEDGQSVGGKPYLRWKTACGRYRVTRVDHLAMEKVVFAAEAFAADGKPLPIGSSGTYVKYHNTLRSAVEVCEDDLAKENGLPVQSNRETFLDANRDASPKSVPVADDEVDEGDIMDGVARVQEEGGWVVKVAEEQARALMASLKAEKNARASLKELAKKLNSMPVWAAKLDMPEDKGMKRLFNRLTKAVQDGDVIEVEVSVLEAKSDAVESAPKAKPEAKPAKPKAESKPAKDKTKPTKSRPTPAPVATTEAKPANKTEATKPADGLSVTSQLYLAWKAKGGKPADYFGDFPSLKEDSIKWYIGKWKNGQKLPKVAKA